ncbi:MAG: citrate synthase [Clostridia bacterium]|nr:citrate synthase [Clostridia bacterium]
MCFSDENQMLKELTEKFSARNKPINPSAFERYNVKRGLRNQDGTGVMAGLTKICSVEGYYMDDGEKIPKEGRLVYRGLDFNDIVKGCQADDRFGFEEVVYLLIFGSLPTADEYGRFSRLLSENRELPQDFVEDVIMRAPSPDIMNKMGSSINALYAYDEDPDDLSAENVLRQSIRLIAQLPAIMTYAYQVKRRFFYKKSMYIHQVKPELKAAESILHAIRSDKKFTDKEAKLLDLCLMIHADHGGGTNSTFTTRCVTSTGTDTYAAIAAAIASLKGPRHGGASIKAARMAQAIKEQVRDVRDDDEIASCLRKIVHGEMGDGSGLIYGMGHAVYTLSDPRAVLLKANARELATEKGFLDDWLLLDAVERLTPAVFAEEKGVAKKMCANVDLYSGLVYKSLGIPEDLYLPMFATARIVGWCAHRLEELSAGGRIMRPAYKNVALPKRYVPLAARVPDDGQTQDYIPRAER